LSAEYKLKKKHLLLNGDDPKMLEGRNFKQRKKLCEKCISEQQ